MTNPSTTTPYPPGEPEYCAATSRSGLHAVPLTRATGAAGINRIAEALCGQLVNVMTRSGPGWTSNAGYPAMIAEAAAAAGLCEVCAWTRACRTGFTAVHAELERIHPPAEDLPALTRLPGDPMLAYRTAARIIGAHDDDILFACFGGTATDNVAVLLAHVARHRAVLHIYPECTAGDCDHPQQDTLDDSAPVCLTPSGYAACVACGVYDAARNACPEAVTLAPCSALAATARSYGTLKEEATA